MRIVIDLQGAQTGSRLRGIGRYTLSLVNAMIRNKGDHEIILALNDSFPETINPIREAFQNILPKDNIRIWHSLGSTSACNQENVHRRKLAELLREAFLADLKPDVILVSSLFEGLGDDAITSIGRFDQSIPTAVILYDLIPLLNPDNDFKNSSIHKIWYAEKIEAIRKSKMLLAISESSRSEALIGLNYDPNYVINISGACDEFFKLSENAKIKKSDVWRKFGIEKPFVMYTGGADERKNLDLLIIAYSQLEKEIRRLHQLVFVGHMPMSHVNNYLLLAKKMGLSEKDLILTGYVEEQDLLALYNTCQLFVFPSLHEGFGLPPLEAMACGAAVIGSNSTSLPEVFGWNEAMFDPTSTTEITKKITRALTDKNFHEQLVQHGALQHKLFNWNESAIRAISALERFAPIPHDKLPRYINFEKSSIFNIKNQSILVLKLDHIGDFILAIPALMKLRAKYPYAEIDIVTGSWNKHFAERLGIFNKIYIFDFFKKKSSLSSEYEIQSLNNLIKSSKFYDIAIDLRRQPDTRFILCKFNANIKVGYQTFNLADDSELSVMLRAHPDIPGKPSPFNTTSISVLMIRLIDAIPFNPNDFITFPRIVTSEQKTISGSVSIFPRAGTDAREWGFQHFVDLTKKLANNPLISEINVYFTNKDESTGFPIGGKIHLHIGLEMAELTESLAKNALCIANNSGGAHLASYLGLKVIGIYSGHEMPDEWGPQFFDSYVMHRAASCSPCHGALPSDCPIDLYCLKDISVSDVYDKVIQMFNNNTTKIQINSDVIIHRLFREIAKHITVTDDSYLLKLSDLISMNHPDYPLPPDLTRLNYEIKVDHRSNILDWIGFSGIEKGYRWTDGHHAKILFDFSGPIKYNSYLELEFDTFGEQNITITINESIIFEGPQIGSNITLVLPLDNLKLAKNELKFDLPDAKIPGGSDTRKVGLAIRSLKIT